MDNPNSTNDIVYFIGKEQYTGITYFKLERAIENCPSGYSVYDSNGNKLYSKSDYERMFYELKRQVRALLRYYEEQHNSLSVPNQIINTGSKWACEEIIGLINNIEKEAHKDEQNRCI